MTNKPFLRKYLRAIAILSVLPITFATQAGRAATPAPDFGAAAFSSIWARTDAPVASQAVKRTWFWGPQPNSPALLEDYAEGVGGKRLVQYFDKSRMEINNPSADPASPFYVTNGLLTVELISGRMQTGNNTFVTRQPSRTNVTGDPGDPLSPTYADLAGVSNALAAKPDSDRTGQAVTSTLSRDGKTGSDPSKAALPGVNVVYYDKTSGHNIPQVMWDFLNSSGQVRVSGALTDSRLIDPWFYASGLPISDPYWVRATIAGKPTDVLLQAYERRVLTYVPANPDGFKVEMGNIGQHYYDWRYKQPGDGTPIPAHPTATPIPSGPATISRYAVDILGDTSAGTLNNVSAAGAGAVRVQIDWSAIEPQREAPAQYNWAYSDAIFQALSNHGLQPISLIEYCPVWACTRPSGPIREDAVADFATFMSSMSARYSKPPYNAHFWEMWNEPDGIGDSVPGTSKHYSWGSNGDRYAAMLKAIRPGVKAADPQAMIVLGGIAYDAFRDKGGTFNRQFLDDVFAAGGAQYLDALNFHYYPNNVNWCTFSDKLKELRDFELSQGVNLPFISTETGLGSDPARGSSDRAQSTYVAQAYAQTAGEKMLTTAWFLAHDLSSGGDPFQRFGLFDLSGAGKPSSYSYRVVAGKIGQRPATRALGENDGLYGRMRGYEFGPDAQHSGKLWVIWAWDENPSGMCGAPPGPVDFALPGGVSSRLSGAFDMYGQPLNVTKRPDGSAVVSLDARPIYVEWGK